MYTNLYGLPTIIFRYFNVYGERQPIRGQYAPVIGIFLRQNASGEPLTIVGNGSQRRDFVYVGDVCKANILAAVSEVDSEAFGQVYNVGTGRSYSINHISRLISNNTINIAPRQGEVLLSCSNSSKLRNTFGWNPEMNLEEWVGNQL
jgi:UDP-glucose 4-epimerase